MNATEQHLKRIQDKLQQLLKNYSALQKENERLKHELEKDHKEAKDQQKKVEELKQQVDILRLNAGDMSDIDKKEFEKRINSYLREIDRCIVLLSE
jgi:NADP-dependent 3-hydroxy acid dehydrogenase YdfG